MNLKQNQQPVDPTGHQMRSVTHNNPAVHVTTMAASNIFRTNAQCDSLSLSYDYLWWIIKLCLPKDEFRLLKRTLTSRLCKMLVKVRALANVLSPLRLKWLISTRLNQTMTGVINRPTRNTQTNRLTAKCICCATVGAVTNPVALCAIRKAHSISALWSIWLPTGYKRKI